MNTITVIHKTGGYLAAADPPSWVGAMPETLITVKGKNYWVVSVVGDLELGPAVITVR